MPRKCPPGVLCIENMTLLFLGSLVFITWLLYSKYSLNNNNTKERNNVIVIKDQTNEHSLESRMRNMMNFGMTRDILSNPYAPPLRDGNVHPPNMGDPRGLPFNIPTQSVNTNYRQVGILTRENGDETILPLMGRPLFANRNKWQFYTMSDKNNSVKLPVSNNGRSCTGEYGCDDLTNGDSVYVEGYNDAFNVTIYDNQNFSYNPFI